MFALTRTGLRFLPNTPRNFSVSFFQILQSPLPRLKRTSKEPPVLVPGLAHFTVNGSPLGARSRIGFTLTRPVMSSLKRWSVQ